MNSTQGDENGKKAAYLDAQGENETILVVDDEDVACRVTENFLKKLGYTVLIAEDGQKGVEIYAEQKNNINLVILDITMPIMSGQKALEKMIELNPDVKVIISSGRSKEELNNDILSRVRGYIGKPYRIADLAQKIRKVLDS